MTQIPAGWYPDPAQTHPARQRYWDGQQWTEHVHDPQPAAPPAYPQYPAGQYPAGPATGYPQSYGQNYGPGYGPGYAPNYGQVAYAPVAPQPRTTPDGQPLSGWWRRVLAQILDSLILSPVYLGILAAFAAANWDEVRTWFDDYTNAVDAGTSVPSPPDLLQPYSSTQLAVFGIYTVVLAVYTLAFWRCKQATPGKLMLGIRIRRRDTPGPLPWSTMLTRFVFVAALALAAYVPYVGLAFLLAGLLDYLWPLWDGKNQALHEKLARTNVVLAPRPADQPSTEELSAAGLPRRW